MTKTIFVVGCSFSHSDVYVNVNETWPYYLHEETGYKIINCATPGSSNLSYFYRLKDAERIFGKPDKVIVQMTTPHRVFFHLENLPLQDLIQYDNKPYYYDPYDLYAREAGAHFTPSVLKEPSKVALLFRVYKLRPHDIKSYFRHFMSEASQMWQINKEMMLIDRYFNDCLFFSWKEKYDIDVKHYVGSVKEDILGEEAFKQYSFSKKDWHFNELGHKKLSEVLLEYV